MYRTFPAFENQFKRFLVTKEFICNIVIRLGAINSGYDMFKVTTADASSRFKVKPVHKKRLFSGQNALNINLGNSKRIRMEIESLRFCRGSVDAGGHCRDLSQQRIMSLSRTVAADKNRIHSLLVETHHVIFRNIRLDLDVRYIHIDLIRITHQHIHSL